MTRLIATFFYTGLLPKAPGTWGSVAAWLFAVIGFWLGLPTQILFLLIIIVTFVGWWATAVETRGSDDHDPSEIVIDEVAGQWIALLPLYAIAQDLNLMERFQSGASTFQHALNLNILFFTAFILFRIFDIFKPWPVSWADRTGSAFGVMLDDILAGLMSWLPYIAFVALILWFDG